METFWTLGQAIAGIFTAVVLTGILAGVVSYGIVDGWLRGSTQLRLIEQMLHPNRQRDEWSPDPLGEVAPRYERSPDFYPEGAMYLPKSLALDPGDFFALPYRQLCGQLAGRISADVASVASKDGSSGLSLFLARYVQKPDFARSEGGPEDFKRTAERALTWVDRLQIRLATGVTRSASRVAMQIVALIYMTVLFPFSVGVSGYRQSSSWPSGTLSLIFWSIIAFMIIAMLAFGSLIIARLTFWWVDNLASPR